MFQKSYLNKHLNKPTAVRRWNLNGEPEHKGCVVKYPNRLEHGTEEHRVLTETCCLLRLTLSSTKYIMSYITPHEHTVGMI